MDRYDLIVIGAGAMGSAAAYYAAKAGRRVLLLEQYSIDHQRGSSYGYSRIIRYAYDHPVYVELMQAAYPAWVAFEADSGESLYVRTGGIDFGAADDAGLASVIRYLAEADIPHEVLTGAEARSRFPQFQFDDDLRVLYQADAGILRASRSVRAHVRMAQQYGAVVRDNTPVRAIRSVGDGVEVETAGETFGAARLIVAAGGWMRSLLLPLGIDLPLEPLAAQEAYWHTADPDAYTADHLPIFITHENVRTGIGIYGLPSVDGSGLKVGLHGGPPVNPDSAERVVDTEAVEKVRQFLARTMPQTQATLAQARVCIYTMTPDTHFIIDQHPAYPQIVIGSCCSGHGFKFSTLIGSILSDLALTGATAHDISLFRLSRFEGVFS